MLIGLACALGAALLYGVAAVAQAIASRRLPEAGAGWRATVAAVLHEPLFAAVVLGDLVGATLHLIAIDLTPLYLAQAGIAASLPVTALVSARMLRERLGRPEWAAVVATGAGIAMLAAVAGEAGAAGGSTTGVVALYVALAGLLVTGLAASRLPARAAGAALSLLSGLGYSCTTLGVRVLGTPDWSVRTVLLVVVMAACGGLGFGLYSLALQRVSVAGATAPMILAETAVPSAVGVLFLGDTVGSGALPVIVAGLVLAVVGSIRLSGFEGRALEEVGGARGTSRRSPDPAPVPPGAPGT